MKLIKPSYQIMHQEPGIDGLLKHIELCGRTAYKSEDKITEDSAPKFVDMIIKRGHTAVLEHCTIYLTTSILAYWYKENKYSVVNTNYNELGAEILYITTNYRVLVENGWLDDLQYQCEPTEFHEKRLSVKFILDRGVSHQYVRHRIFSFVQESTRYCNYSKTKFGNEITYIEPSWFEKNNILGLVNKSASHSVHSENTYSTFEKVIFEQETEKINKDTNERTPWSAEDWYIYSLKICELAYTKILEQGWSAQQARAVLPNSLKTELIMTGTISQWEEFFKLRCPVDAHPSARELAVPLKQTFIEKGFINENYL